MNPKIIERIRQLTKKDKKKIYQRIIKLQEECGEVSDSFLRYDQGHGSAYKGDASKHDIGEECIDTIIVAFSIIDHLVINEQWVEEKFWSKLEKWNHVLEQGKEN